MTLRSYAHASDVARWAFEKDFSGITVTTRPVQSERAIHVIWTDGPTHSQVETALLPYLSPIAVRTYRHLSEGFRSLLADDIELGADPGHEDEHLASRIHRLSLTTSVDGERCVWSVPA